MSTLAFAPTRKPVFSGRVLAASIAALLGALHTASAGNTWDGGGGDNNWSTGTNWAPDGPPTYGTLIFSGTTRTANFNNSITAMNQVQWNNATGWTVGGSSTLSLFDFGGTQAKLENLGSGTVSISAPITFAANNGAPPNPFGEINAVSGNFIFSGNLTVNGSSVNGIKLFGGVGRDVTFASGATVNAPGKWFGFTNANGSSVTIQSGATVTSGDFYAMNGGTLRLAGGFFTTSAVRLGGDFGNTGNQNLALGGTLALTSATGGVNFGSVINTVSGNTSNALLIDSQNTSGSNSLTSGVFLDSDLRVQQATGGSLGFSVGTFDVKGRRLTVDGGGTVTVSQSLSSSLGAGGSLVKQGSGTLILANASNNYTGTNNSTLNANGTQIAGGTLGIQADTSLGLVPAGAYNNVQFTGSGTLRASGGSISLNANRNVSVATGATATFDNNGNTFTIGGVINGTGGNLATTGSGTVVLTGSNTYTGTTSVGQGTLQLNTANALGTAAGGTTVANGASLRLNGLAYTTAEPLSLNGSGLSGSGALRNVGTSSFAGPITVATNSLVHAGGGSLTLTGGIAKNGTVLTFGGGGTVNVNTLGITGAAPNSDLVVDGTTVNLNVANTYNGPTGLVNGATLNANVLLAIPADTDLSLDTTGSGGSTLALITDQVADTLTAAANSTINLNDAELNLSTGLTLNGTNSSPVTLSFDLLTPATSGLLSLDGGTFTGAATGGVKISLSGPTATPGTYTLIDWGVATPVGVELGDFFLDPANSLPAPLDSYVLQISGSQLNLMVAVPEPATAAAPFAAMLGLLARRRRRSA